MKHRSAARYGARPITHLEMWQHEGWRVKVYGIAASGGRPSSALVEAIKREAAARLPLPAVTAVRYGEGFLYAHQGVDGGGFASVNWWANENELYHFQYEAPAEDPGRLRPVEATGGSSMCVWDIAVIAHERQAWIDHVLNNDAGPDLASYAAATLNAEV